MKAEARAIQEASWFQTIPNQSVCQNRDKGLTYLFQLRGLFSLCFTFLPVLYGSPDSGWYGCNANDEGDELTWCKKLVSLGGL